MSYIPNPQSSQVLSHWFSRCARAVAGRLRGPGGYYNAGNLFGLVVTLTAPFAVGVQAGAAPGGLDIVIVNFAGSPSAVALTSATAIFLVSGEMYHRAGTGRSLPDAAHNQFADALSAIGSLVLTISLLFTGQWGLAIASGLLTVGGKLGSALFGDDGSWPGFWPTAWVDPFRGAVLVGRAAGVMAAALDFGFRVVNWSESSLLSLIQSGTLVFCYLLWVRADLLLAIGARVRENEDVIHVQAL